MNSEFVDHYQVLEVHYTASGETIERVFRYLANKNHPDIAPANNAKCFKQLIEAFETLRDPELRAAYDLQREARFRENQDILQDASEAENDCIQRANLLSVFYAKRRQDMKEPGVSVGRLEDITNCDRKVLEFHLWYFKKKGWIEREESGLMSITVEGVDKIEETYLQSTLTAVPRIEHQAIAIPSPHAPADVSYCQ